MDRIKYHVCITNRNGRESYHVLYSHKTARAVAEVLAKQAERGTTIYLDDGEPDDEKAVFAILTEPGMQFFVISATEDHRRVQVAQAEHEAQHRRKQIAEAS